MLLTEAKSEQSNKFHLFNLFALPLLIFMSGLAAVTMFQFDVTFARATFIMTFIALFFDIFLL